MKIIIIFLVLATIYTAISTQSSSENTPTITSEETTQSTTKDLEYQKWKNKTDKKITEKYDNKQKNYYNRKNKDLMSSIASALSRPNLTAAQIRELTSAYSELSESNGKSLNLKKRAYETGFYTLLRVLEG